MWILHLLLCWQFVLAKCSIRGMYAVSWRKVRQIGVSVCVCDTKLYDLDIKVDGASWPPKIAWIIYYYSFEYRVWVAFNGRTLWEREELRRLKCVEYRIQRYKVHGRADSKLVAQKHSIRNLMAIRWGMHNGLYKTDV